MIGIMLHMPSFCLRWSLNVWQPKHVRCSLAVALLAHLITGRFSTEALDAAISATTLLCWPSMTDGGRQRAPGPVLRRAVCVQQHTPHVIGAAGHSAQHQAQPRHFNPAAIEHCHQLVQGCATRTSRLCCALVAQGDQAALTMLYGTTRRCQQLGAWIQQLCLCCHLQWLSHAKLRILGGVTGKRCDSFDCSVGRNWANTPHPHQSVVSITSEGQHKALQR